MVENCYILYSCDGSYDPIVSNYSGLSSFTQSYISIEILDTNTIPDTCFYVLNIGVVDCNPTYSINVVSGSSCSCECYCYFIKSNNVDTDVEYVNCNNDIVVETIQQNLTYNICSKIFPQFNSDANIPIKLTDICINNQCPPSIPSIKPPNECDVITIFPMGVECLVNNPTSDQSFDGLATLIVTGGTPPYTIFWEIGSFAPALSNIGVGEYNATVVDYYGDFTANTTCVLTAETQVISGMCFTLTGISRDELVYISTNHSGIKNGKPYYEIQYGVTIYGYVFWDGLNQLWTFCSTLDCQGSSYNILDNNNYFYPTGTTSGTSWQITSDSPYLITESYVGICAVPKPEINLTNLCGTAFIRGSKGDEFVKVVNIQFEPAGYLNDQPYWSATTNDYNIYWNTGSTPNQWTLSSSTLTTTSVSTNDPSYPPLSNWVVYGNPKIISFDTNLGLCNSAYTISVELSVNNADCNPTGSITAQAFGGVAPYQYSIDGGVTYGNSPIFNNLAPGSYVIYVQDSNSVVGVSQTVQIISTSPTQYTLTLSVNYNNNTFTINSPILPNGVTISFNLNHSSTFNYYPSTIPTPPTYNNLTTINTIGTMTLTNTMTNLYSLGGPCNVGGSILVFQQNLQYTNTLAMGSNQTLTGSITNNIINNPTGLCQFASGYYTLTISNGSLNNCDCCNINLINTTPPSQFPVQ